MNRNIFLIVEYIFIFSGYIKVKTIAIAEDCVVARMTKLVEDSHRRKSKTERLVDTCAKYYIPG